jgi:hypothetical protein
MPEVLWDHPKLLIARECGRGSRYGDESCGRARGNSDCEIGVRDDFECGGRAIEGDGSGTGESLTEDFNRFPYSARGVQQTDEWLQAEIQAEEDAAAGGTAAGAAVFGVLRRGGHWCAA